MLVSNRAILDSLMESPRIRNLGLKEETISDILKVYNNIIIDILLENGTIDLNNGIVLDVVHLLDRVHTLRGINYPNTRKFKLRVTLTDELYKKIEDYYNKLKEDIM